MDYHVFFQVKKWTLVALISLQAVGFIIYAGFSHVFLRLRVENSDAHTTEEEDAIRSSALAVILVISILGVIVQLIGLGGVTLEYLPLVGVYGVLQLAGTVGVIVQASLAEPVYWACAGVGMAIILLVIIYAVDLYRYEKVPSGEGYCPAED